MPLVARVIDTTCTATLHAVLQEGRTNLCPAPSEADIWLTCCRYTPAPRQRQCRAGVFLDLHAAPGSQNGNDNSAPAQQGVIGWDADPNCMLQAAAFLNALAARYAAAPALLGFGLLNEPAVRSRCSACITSLSQVRVGVVPLSPG